jgi:hypothetical protein
MDQSEKDLIKKLTEAINRNSEIVALAAGLRGTECAFGCGRFATQKEVQSPFMRVCDKCASTKPEGTKLIERASAKRARRLEALLKGK